MTGATVPDVGVQLLSGFDVTRRGVPVRLPLGGQRLLAYVALSGGGAHRSTCAEELWPGCARGRAGANVRSALSHVRRLGRDAVIEARGPRLSLAAGVRVDLAAVSDRVNEQAWVGSADPMQIEALHRALSHELLAGWADDWLISERERWDQIRLHSLENLARRLLAAGRYLPALEAALTAVSIEPVRESAHRTVVEVFIAEGNAACALKHYQRFRGLVQREMGVGPSPHMTRLVHSLVAT